MGTCERLSAGYATEFEQRNRRVLCKSALHESDRKRKLRLNIYSKPKPLENSTAFGVKQRPPAQMYLGVHWLVRQRLFNARWIKRTKVKASDFGQRFGAVEPDPILLEKGGSLCKHRHQYCYSGAVDTTGLETNASHFIEIRIRYSNVYLTLAQI